MRVQLNTAYVSDDREVWTLFPGSGYKFASAIFANSRVFLDFPGLEVPKDPAALRTKEFLQALVISERVREWHDGGKADDKNPSRSTKDYPTVRWSQARTTAAGEIHRLLHIAKQGDLVVVPSFEPETGRRSVAVGRFIDRPSARIGAKIRGVYDGEKIPSRRVQWLGSRGLYKCSEELYRRVVIPNPFTLLARSVREEIYEIAYKSYIFKGKYYSRFDVKAEEYNSKHELSLQLIVNYAAKATELTSLGQRVDGSLSQLAINEVGGEFIPDLSLSINSPGRILLESFRAVPLVAAVVFSVAVAACDAAGGGVTPPLPNGDHIEIVVDEDMPAECVVEVEETVRAIFRTMQGERWAEICRVAVSARDGAAISTSVTVSEGHENVE